jgi:hypothetical protein
LSEWTVVATRTVYLVLKASPWSAMSTTILPGVSLDGGPGLGFCPIYETEEEAAAEYPATSVYAVQVSVNWGRDGE